MNEAQHDQIRQMEQAYSYDAAYLHDLVDRSPAGYDAFSKARPMTSYRKNLPADAHYVAAITVMQVEDCGSCLELNLRLALEAGISRDLLRTLLESPEDLPEPLRQVRDHALAVVHGQSPDVVVAEQIEQHYGSEAFAELALCIAGVRIYPALKRSLLKADACSTNVSAILDSA